jgi:hypothetical protein
MSRAAGCWAAAARAPVRRRWVLPQPKAGGAFNNPLRPATPVLHLWPHAAHGRAQDRAHAPQRGRHRLWVPLHPGGHPAAVFCRAAAALYTSRVCHGPVPFLHNAHHCEFPRGPRGRGSGERRARQSNTRQLRTAHVCCAVIFGGTASHPRTPPTPVPRACACAPPPAAAGRGHLANPECQGQRGACDPHDRRLQRARGGGHPRLAQGDAAARHGARVGSNGPAAAARAQRPPVRAAICSGGAWGLACDGVHCCCASRCRRTQSHSLPHASFSYPMCPCLLT